MNQTFCDKCGKGNTSFIELSTPDSGEMASCKHPERFHLCYEHYTEFKNWLDYRKGFQRAENRIKHDTLHF